MSQSAASQANSLACEGKNSQHQPVRFQVTMKGHIPWTKVTRTFCVYWDPGFPWETHTTVSYDFLELLLHLVRHTPWSTPVLSWLLGASQGKGISWN
jgi:hypothetical protein